MSVDWRWQPELLSVVVPTYNRHATLARVLAGFAQQTLPPDRFEVLVVDDGSTDATCATITAAQASLPYRLTALAQPNAGPAAARNLGLRAAGGQVVVFVDDDCLPTPDLLALHRAAHEVEGLAAIGRIAWHPDLTVTPLMRVLEADTYAYANIAVPFDASFFCYYTGNASVHRESALAIGGFDETFPHWHEDIEFAYRLRCHGVRFIFAGEALVHHWRPVDLKPTLAAQQDKGRELVRLFDKHPELRRYLPVERLADPSVTHDFFRVLLHQALLDGVAQGVAALPSDDPLLPRLHDEQMRWADRRVTELHATLLALEAEIGRLREVEAATPVLQSEHARLERAFQAQAAWATDLERRLAQPRLPARMRASSMAGARAAIEAAHAGLSALFAFRRGGDGPPELPPR